MNIRLKYPQKFKKQHKSRTLKFNSPIVTNAKSNMVGVYSTTNVLVPNRFISYIRKLIKKFLKKRNMACWFRLEPNRVITSKAKNSRMGKGVGTVNRTGFYIKCSKPLMVFSNISDKRASHLAALLQPRFPSRLYAKKL